MIQPVWTNCFCGADACHHVEAEPQPKRDLFEEVRKFVGEIDKANTKHVLVCHPDNEEQIKSIVDEYPQTNIGEVIASIYIPLDKIIIINPHGLGYQEES